MNKFRKLGLRISLALFTLGAVLWCAGIFMNTNAEDFQALAIYLIVSSVFFASPYMIITNRTENEKTKAECYADFAISGFYTIALAFVLYNAIPYFSSNEAVSALQTTGQFALAVSFLWTLCLHSWSTFANLMKAFASPQS